MNKLVQSNYKNIYINPLHNKELKNTTEQQQAEKKLQSNDLYKNINSVDSNI